MPAKGATPVGAEGPEARLAQLIADNERLQAELAVYERDSAVRAQRGPGAYFRSLGAVVFILLGSLIAPSAIVASWAATELSDTDRFVASLAPLSHDPDVRTFIGDAVTAAIQNNIDIDGFTADAFAGIAESLNPPASAAVVALAPAAADGLRQLLGRVVHRVVDSPAFQTVWDKALRLGHTELVAILENDESAAVVVNARGEVGINLEPIVAEVKARLVAENFPLADRIPTVTSTITVATVDNIGQLRASYDALMVSSAALPWLGLLFLIVGVLLARSRPLGVMGVGIGLVVVTALMLVSLRVGRGTLVANAEGLGAPRSVTETVFDALTTQVRGAGLALLLIGAIFAAVGFLLGRSRAAVAIRARGGLALAGIHGALDRHGLGWVRTGEALHRARFALWTGIAVIVVVILLLSRPLTPATVGWTALVVAVVAVLFALLERPATRVVEV